MTKVKMAEKAMEELTKELNDVLEKFNFEGLAVESVTFKAGHAHKLRKGCHLEVDENGNEEIVCR